MTSESIDLTDSEIAIHVGGNISGSADYCFFDEFKIEGIKNSFAISSNLTQQVNLSVNESSQVIWTLNASGSDDDSQSFFAFANRTNDLLVSNTTDTWNLTVSDNSAPAVSISTPTNDLFSSNTGLNINYTATSGTLDSCWYNNDSMLINTTLASCANITSITWSQGQHNVTIYANDTSGNVGEATVNFTIDSINPLISISSPSNASITNNSVLSINYSSSDTNLGSCWYSNDTMLTNTTLASCANITAVIWSEGEHNVTIWANDSAGNLNNSQITFFIDGPLISFINPTPTNASTVINGFVEINLSFTEDKLNETVYNWNGTNYTLFNDSLVLMLNFDNISSIGENDTSIVDHSRYENNASSYNGSLYTPLGKYGGAITFDGVGSYFNVSNHDSLNFDTSDFSINLWFKANSLPAGGSAGQLFAKRVNGLGDYEVQISNTGIITAYIQQNGADLDNFNGGYDITNRIGEWIFLTLNREGTSIKIFVDGVLNATGTSNQNVTSTSDLTFGSDGDGGFSEYFNGSIDEVRIYKRSLSANEIYQLYASNLKKTDINSWEFYINQSFNSTTNLTYENYTYFGAIKDDPGVWNLTLTRDVVVSNASGPTLTINNPTNDIFSNDTGLDILYTVSSSTLDECWYSNDSMLANTTLAGCANVTALTWSEGDHNVTIYANDSNGVTSSLVNFTIDSIYPTISISSPTNGSESINNTLKIYYSVNDTNVDSCWYSNDSMISNVTLSGCANITSVNWSEGEHNVSVWVNDSSGNLNSSSVTFEIDSINPLISIVSPSNNSFTNDTGLNVTFSVSDTNLESCWYSNDSMLGNTTLTGCANITALTWSEGEHNVSVWANDSFGNINGTSITFNIDSSALSISILDPSSNFYTTNSSIHVNYSVSGDNIDSCWYTNDSMTSNTTLAGCANITSVSWGEGQHNVTIYANDSVGTINSGSLTFYVDLSGPNVTLVSPTNNNVDNSVGDANVLFNCSVVDNLNLANVSLYITNSSNSSFILNQTTNISGESTSSNWTLGLSNGNYTWSCLVSDEVGFNNWSVSNFSLVVNSSVDVDSDGLADSNDRLLFNESNVTKSGLTRLNVTVGGNGTFNRSFSDVHQMLFYDDTSLMMNFSHNFTSKTFSLKNVTVTKTSTSLIVNLSGQLGPGINKTLYISDNSFVSLCVKDAEIGVIGEISSGCNDDNETDFTTCIGSLAGVNLSGLECYDEGSVFRIENLQFSGARGTQAASSSGGSSGGSSSSSSSGGGEIFAGDEIEDFSVTFREGVEYPIFIDKEYHTFKIVDLKSDSATLLFYSLESRVDIKLDELVYLDYDRDGYYDLEILLEKVYGDRAKVVFKFINVKIDDVVEQVNQEIEVIEEVDKVVEKKSVFQVVKKVAIDYNLWLYFMLFLAVGFLIYVWYRYKNRLDYH